VGVALVVRGQGDRSCGGGKQVSTVQGSSSSAVTVCAGKGAVLLTWFGCSAAEDDASLTQSLR
jgi:hypothetical protein